MATGEECPIAFASHTLSPAELDGWLKSVDKSGLPGKFKGLGLPTWHSSQDPVTPPCLRWSLSLTVETLERRVSNHLRRWLGLPRSLSRIALYGNTNKLQLPFKSLEEEFKVTRARAVFQYRDSSDPKVAKAGIQVRTWQEMEGRGSSSRGRCKAASQEPGGSGHTRSIRARILSNSPNEHQGEGRATTCSGGGESSSGGDENLQGSGNEATGSFDEMGECG